MTLPRGRGPASARIMLVGEAWGRNEAQQGLPFVGPAGNVLNELLLKAGIDPDSCYFTNIINQQPPANDLSAWIPKGIPNELATEGLLQLSEEITDVNPNIIVPLGNWPLWAFYNKKVGKSGTPTGILDYRGYILEARKLARGRKIIPTVHPSYILQGRYSDAPLAILDLKRAKAESAFPDIRRRPRTAIVDPQGAEREAIRQRLLREGRWLCVDIEYIGSKLLCVGFAVSAEWAVTIRIRGSEDLAWCRSLIESGRPLLAQNGMFDLGILDWHYKINAMQHLEYDTMVAAYNINIEMKKDLGFLGSMYTDVDAWWSVIDWNAIRDGKQDPDVVLEYNCYDNMVTYEVAEKQLPELESDPKMLEAFRFDMAKLLPLWEIAKVGVKIDVEKVRALRTKAESDRDDGQSALNVIAETYGVKLNGLDINIKSGPQMVDFLFERVGVPRGGQTSGGVTGTKKQWKTDNVTLMESMRKSEAPIVRKILELVIRTREARDLISKFADIEWDDDGRARCIYSATTTVTRRLSAKTFFPTGKGSNLQNMPAPGSSSYGELVRSCFQADGGYEFGYADLKGAEFLIVAEETQDPLMLRYAAMTINGTGDVHRETAAFIFSRIRGIPLHPEDFSKESPERFLGKKTRHSANYMIGWKELMGRINAEAMDTGVFVTAAEVKAILFAYYELHPGLRAWWYDLEAEVYRTGMLRNLFGFPRRFHDRVSSCLPEIVAFRPQSTVGDALNYGLVACHNDPELRRAGFQILLNVHDAIGFQFRRGTGDTVLPRVNELMAIPLLIPKTGNQLRIPVEIAVGPNWGELKAVKGF